MLLLNSYYNLVIMLLHVIDRLDLGQFYAIYLKWSANYMSSMFHCNLSFMCFCGLITWYLWITLQAMCWSLLSCQAFQHFLVGLQKAETRACWKMFLNRSSYCSIDQVLSLTELVSYLSVAWMKEEILATGLCTQYFRLSRWSLPCKLSRAKEILPEDGWATSYN